MKRAKRNLDIMMGLPNPVNVLWELLVDKGIITTEELYKKSLELSGLEQTEFDKRLGMIEDNVNEKKE